MVAFLTRCQCTGRPGHAPCKSCCYPLRERLRWLLRAAWRRGSEPGTLCAPFACAQQTAGPLAPCQARVSCCLRAILPECECSCPPRSPLQRAVGCMSATGRAVEVYSRSMQAMAASQRCASTSCSGRALRPLRSSPSLVFRRHPFAAPLPGKPAGTTLGHATSPRMVLARADKERCALIHCGACPNWRPGRACSACAHAEVGRGHSGAQEVQIAPLRLSHPPLCPNYQLPLPGALMTL